MVWRSRSLARRASQNSRFLAQHFFRCIFYCLIWINELCRLWFERSFPPLWTRTWLCPKAGEKKPLLNLYILWHLMRCPKVMQWVSIHPSSPRTGLVGLPQCSTNRNVDFRNGIACCCNRLWRMSRRGWDETQSNRFRKVLAGAWNHETIEFIYIYNHFPLGFSRA